MKALIANGANVKMVDKYKNTALHLACMKGKQESVDILAT